MPVSIYSWKLMQIKIGSECKIQWPSQSTSNVNILVLNKFLCSSLSPLAARVCLTRKFTLGWDGVWIWGETTSPVWTFLSISMCEQVFTLQSSRTVCMLSLVTQVPHISKYKLLCELAWFIGQSYLLCFVIGRHVTTLVLLYMQTLWKVLVSPIQMPTVLTGRCTNHENCFD